MADTQAILVVDASPSRIRFEAFAVCRDEEIAPLYEGRIASIGRSARFLVKNPFGSRLLDKIYAPGEIPDLRAAAAQLLAWMRSMHLHDRLLGIGHCIRAQSAAPRTVGLEDDALDEAQAIPPASLAVIECFGSHPSTSAQFAVFGPVAAKDASSPLREAGAQVLHSLKEPALASARIRNGSGVV